MSINTVEIERVLEQMAFLDKNRFNAYYVAHFANQTDVDMVNDYLLMKAQFGALMVKVETICPNGHIDHQFDLKVIPEDEIECRFCDEDEAIYIPDAENTNIVYYFSAAYSEEVKKKVLSQLQMIAI